MGDYGYDSLKAAREIAKTNGGYAVMRILQAHGFNQIVSRDSEGHLLECCSLERMFEEMDRVDK